MIETLEQWQTLVGGVLGGVFALGAALIVSLRAERRQDQSAAMLVIGNLNSILTHYRGLKKAAIEAKVPANQLSVWMLEQLVAIYPSVGTAFESSSMRLYPVNASLAARLDTFKTIYNDIEARILQVRSQEAKSRTERHQGMLRTVGIKPHADAIQVGLKECEKHATAAIELLNFLVLSKTPNFNKMRLHFFPPKKVRQSLL